MQLSRWYYSHCTLCDAPSTSALCTHCVNALPVITSACIRCAVPIPLTGICGDCMQRHSPLDETHAILAYQDRAQWLITQLKYNKAYYLRPIVRTIMAQYAINNLSLPTADAIVPMPMHIFRWYQRGYNQVDCMAEAIGAATVTPVIKNLIKRTGYTPRFALGKTKKQRKTLIKNVFEVCEHQTMPQRIIIVDDVMTTGSSCETLASLLKNNGAEHVYALVLARAQKK